MNDKKESRIGRIFKRILNIRAWIDYDRVKSITMYLIDGLKKLFIPSSEKGKKESFEVAVKKLHLNEQQLIDKKKALIRLTYLMCFLALTIFLYAIYQSVYGSWKAVIVSFVITWLALILAFRYHFWYYQIKERKLGCTLKEWYRQGLIGKRK